MDRIIRSSIQRAIAFTNDHSAIQACQMGDVLLMCHKGPEMQYIYTYLPNCHMNFRNNKAISIILKGLF